jgi:dTMP kinase
VSAAIVFRLPIPRTHEHHEGGRPDVGQTLRDIKEGITFIASHPVVRGILVGLGVGLIGAGAMIPLGPVFAKQGLGGDAAAFGVLMTALGFGAAGGVVALLVLQQRLNKETFFEFAIMGTGVFLVVAASCTGLGPAALAIVFVGACAGSSYVTGFTVLQETVKDELRGRTFAALYTLIRMCLLISLVLSPLWADFWDWVVDLITSNRTVTLMGASYTFPGVRIALWAGGLITLAAGIWARHSIRAGHRLEDAAATAAESTEEGAA